MFRVGQKVVCIREPKTKLPGIVDRPRKGGVYTVRAIVMGYGRDGFKPGLLLCEIHNPIGSFNTEYNFNPRRFRPIVSRQTSIDIFKKMLTPTEETVQ